MDVLTRCSREYAGKRRRRGLAVFAIVASLAFSASACAGKGSHSVSDDVATEPIASAPTATEDAAPSTPSATATSRSPSASATAPSPDSAPAATPDVPASEGDIEGADATPAALVPVVGISDGDTIKVRIAGRTERVRVIGIDAPELSEGQCYAQQAASKMQSLAQGRSVRLEADPTQADRDRHDRLLRHVFLADGRSVAEELIAGGFGREYTYAADYRYQERHRAAERAARSVRKGLWGSACTRPPVADAPARVMADPPASGESTGRCDIKGNINGDGEKIYHVPGARSYDKTKISPGKGERMFCSISDAEAAGWRAARG